MAQAETEKLFYIAVNKFEQGDISSASDLFLDLISRYPDFGKAHNYLGEIYFNYFKDALTAEIYFKKAISSSPEFTDAYINYSKLLLAQERFAEMNANLNKVSEIPGVKKNNLYEEFGLLNELQGKHDEAIGFYKKAIAYAFTDDELIAYEKAISRCGIKKKYL